jgi:hypothetical protein
MQSRPAWIGMNSSQSIRRRMHEMYFKATANSYEPLFLLAVKTCKH